MAEIRPGDPNCKCKGYGCVACMSAHPEGKTCKDCAWFERKCSWMLSYTGAETCCDWIPSRYHQIEEVPDHGWIENDLRPMGRYQERADAQDREFSDTAARQARVWVWFGSTGWVVSTEPPPEFTTTEIVADVPMVDHGRVKLLKHPSQTTADAMAQHVHDCDVCVFLGVYAQFDLWYCPASPEGAGAPNGGSFLARHGNDGPDYSSAPLMTINFYLEKDPQNPLAEAYRRAKAKGLL